MGFLELQTLFILMLSILKGPVQERTGCKPAEGKSVQLRGGEVTDGVFYAVNVVQPLDTEPGDTWSPTGNH